MAVADCYDTMTTIRSYKTAMSPKAARAELAACAGTQFDPKVVRAFLDVSIGRLRPVAGPLAWLGSLPFVGSIPQLGQATVAVLGRVGAASLVVSGAVAVGKVKATPPTTVVPPPANSRSRAAPRPSVRWVSAGLGPIRPRTDCKNRRRRSDSRPARSRRSRGRATPTPRRPRRSGATVPSTVTGVTATAANGLVTVSWTAPYDGGSPITSYTVTRDVGEYPDPVRCPHRPRPRSRRASSTVRRTPLPSPRPTSWARALVGTIAPRHTDSSVPESRQRGTLAGRPQKGDQIIVTFSPAPALNALCGVERYLVPRSRRLRRGGLGNAIDVGNDTITVTDATDCNGGFHFGTIDLGQSGYFRVTSRSEAT